MSTPSSPPAQKYARRNLLVDRPFQLKYTGYIVGLTIAICLPLGLLLNQQMATAVHVGDEAVTIAESANQAAQASLEQATMLNRRLEMESMLKLADKPEELEAVKRANKLESDRIAARADALKKSEAAIHQQRDTLASRRRALLTTVGLAMLFLVVLVGALAISFTHRVAGPIHRMRKLFAEVGDGVFSPYRPLRKKDELQEFFADFSAMVEKIKARDTKNLEKLDQALAKASKSLDRDSLEEIRSVREIIQKDIEGRPSKTKIDVD